MSSTFKKIVFLAATTLPLLLHARKVIVESVQIEKGPWLTGPLLSPSGHVIPFGHQNYEPYFYWTDNKRTYNSHWHTQNIPHYKTFLFQGTVQFGILPNTELDLSPQFAYNNTQGVHTWLVSDFPFALGFQALMDSPTTWVPAMKIRVGAVVPIGKYDRLDPKKVFTDVGGLGNWYPSLGVVFTYTFDYGNYHFLCWRTFFDYSIATPVRVHGLSIYGGAPSINGIKGTRGTVYPGNIFTAIQGFEYTLNLNWVLACDIQYQHFNRTRFSGHSPKGTKPKAPSSEQFSIAPALEYNFNANVGIIAGPWFTVAGRNSNLTFDFISWVLAINIYN